MSPVRLHALRSQTPLIGADLRVQATIMYRERCGIEVKESALRVCMALEENNWDRKPWGGMPDHFRHLAHHINGKVVLLRTNTPRIMDSRFGPDTAVGLLQFGVRVWQKPKCTIQSRRWRKLVNKHA